MDTHDETCPSNERAGSSPNEIIQSVRWTARIRELACERACSNIHTKEKILVSI